MHAARPWGRDPDPRVIAFIDRHKPSRVLDLGTGYGAQAFEMAKMGCRVDAIEASNLAVVRCLLRKNEELDRSSYDRLNLSIGDVTELPYAEDTFQAAVEVAVFQHLSWEAGIAAISEALRVIEPGGRFLSLTAADDYDLAAIPSPSPTRTMTEAEVQAFYRGFTDLCYRRVRHVDGLNRTVSWWHIEGRKPHAVIQAGDRI